MAYALNLFRDRFVTILINVAVSLPYSRNSIIRRTVSQLELISQHNVLLIENWLYEGRDVVRMVAG